MCVGIELNSIRIQKGVPLPKSNFHAEFFSPMDSVITVTRIAQSST